MKRLSIIIAALLTIAGNTAAEPLTPLTIQLYWVPNVQFAGVLVAKERGWYAEQGIDLTIKGWQEGLVTLNEVADGRAQIGVMDGSEIIKARVNNIPVKAIGVQFQRSPFCLMSKKSLNITKPEDLKGKRIGINNSDSALVTTIVLANRGLKYEEITPVQAYWDLQPLIDDQFDAYLAFMNNEPLTMKERGYEVTYLPAFQYGYDFYSSVYFVTDALLTEQPEALRRFLEVTLRGWAEAFKDPAAAAALIVEKYVPDASVAQQTESLKMFQTLATLGDGKKYVGWMEESYWQKGIDILAEFQQIDQKIPASDVFTMDVLNAVYFGKKE